jgi:hypothetical protein
MLLLGVYTRALSHMRWRSPGAPAVEGLLHARPHSGSGQGSVLVGISRGDRHAHISACIGSSEVPLQDAVVEAVLSRLDKRPDLVSHSVMYGTISL